MTQDSAAVLPATGATREEVVEKLEAAFEQIAAELDVPVEQVRDLANRHRLTEREAQIIKLREDGYSNEAIAEKLELSYSTTTQTVRKLIQEGRVTPQRRGPKPPSDEERAGREAQIIKLREDGYSNEAIAEALGLSPGTVALWTHHLIEEGRIKDRRDEQSEMYRDVENQRVQTIILMRKQRATLGEVGDALGVTKERARQLIKKIAAVHGEEVFTPDTPLLTAHEAADELGVSPQIIKQLCANGEVAARRRGIGRKAGYMIEETELEKLRCHPAVTHERVCAVCNQVFVYEHPRGSRTVCDNATCQEERSRRQRAAYTDQPPTLDSLDGWRKDLWQKLQSHRLPKNEEWIAISEAMRRTGLSRMQLVWLRLRNIVTMRPDPVKIAWRTGQSVMLYAASEMEITRQVFEAYGYRNDTDN